MNIENVDDKLSTLKYLYYDFMRDSNIEIDKYALPFILPNIESCLLSTQPFYLKQLKKEIEILKQEINYDNVCQEVNDDMRMKGFLAK